MRKISHWKLAKYLTEERGKAGFRFMFKLGSIMPDILLYTYKKGHSYDTTIDTFKKRLNRLENKGRFGALTGYRLGYAIHYLEDYFTLPHNTNFLGNLREHCAYEKCQQIEFLRRLRLIGKEPHEKTRDYRQEGKLDFCTLLRRMHDDYLHEIPSVDTDCRYIFTATQILRDRLFAIFEKNTIRAAISC